LIAITFAGCALTYELARRSGPLRPLFGLKLHPKREASEAPAPVAA
jgi:hypothetical protein